MLSLSTMDLPARFREFWTSQRMASVRRRTGRTSIGTWYVWPPTRRGLTSVTGMQF